MKAIGYQKSLPITDPSALIDIELPVPVASGQDILVKVEAISVNPVDTKIRVRVSPAENEHQVLGWDAVGTVEAVGDQVNLFKVGDKVWYAGAIDRSGSNAEYHLVDQRIVAKAPLSLTDVEAAALPLTSITAWELLFDRFNLNADSSGTLLIIGAAGGVGSIMIQLAKKLTKLTVIATASRDQTREWVSNLGADLVIDHHKSLPEELAAVGVKSVDYVASLTNTADHLSDIIEAITPQGKMALIDDPDSMDIMPFKRKSVSVHWELMFTRSLFQTEDMIAQHQLLTKVAKMVDQGELKTTVASDFGTINANNLIAAHALLESGKSKGKIVLAGF
ncbi:MAG: zinc-binding alcohol dehydrogenase family protein [Pseudomonadales bacterium]|nr:zinc-binding alcohol dehydrogenase family protein [Pseudomonadales bacterium]NRA15271.1 zinc-binding alcohol dehydrogenase family protein [Oceanospirillaceae bacterium]